jgi:hypothetical protein
MFQDNYCKYQKKNYIFDFETQLASYYLLPTLNIFNIDKNIILEQNYNNRLNSNTIIKLILSSRKLILD